MKLLKDPYFGCKMSKMQKKGEIMSYRCTLCHIAQPQGTEAQFLVTQKRDRIYHCKDKNGKPKTAKSWEIVKEVIVCEDCFRKRIK